MKEKFLDIGFIIKSLSSMKGIDEEFLPKFMFFQIKKSFINTMGDNSEKIIII